MWKIYHDLSVGSMREHPYWKGYYLTETGEVWSKIRRGKYPVIQYDKPARLLSLKTDRNGYLSVIIGGRNGCRCRVHRLMLETYVPVSDSSLMCNHKDGDRSNNNLDNLEWVTNSENQLHRYRRERGD